MTQLMARKNPYDKLSSGTGYSRAESYYTDARIDANTSFGNIPHLRDERCDPSTSSRASWYSQTADARTLTRP